MKLLSILIGLGVFLTGTSASGECLVIPSGTYVGVNGDLKGVEIQVNQKGCQQIRVTTDGHAEEFFSEDSGKLERFDPKGEFGTKEIVLLQMTPVGGWEDRFELEEVQGKVGLELSRKVFELDDNPDQQQVDFVYRFKSVKI